MSQRSSSLQAMLNLEELAKLLPRQGGTHLEFGFEAHFPDHARVHYDLGDFLSVTLEAVPENLGKVVEDQLPVQFVPVFPVSVSPRRLSTDAVFSTSRTAATALGPRGWKRESTQGAKCDMLTLMSYTWFVAILVRLTVRSEPSPFCSLTVHTVPTAQQQALSTQDAHSPKWMHASQQPTSFQVSRQGISCTTQNNA